MVCVCVVCVMCVWYVCDVCGVCVWCVCGVCVICVWYVCGVCVWCVCGVCVWCFVCCVWCVLGVCGVSMWCVCVRARSRWRDIHAHIAKEQQGWAWRLEQGSRECVRQGESNLEKVAHFEAQVSHIRFLDLAHISLLLELNSELYSNLEEKEVVRHG